MLAARSVPLLLVMAALDPAGCSNKPENCTPNFSPGDRFKITINSVRLSQEPCPEMPLHPGDTFLVTASDSHTFNPDSRACYTYAATPDVPDFARGIMKTCAPSNDQLGVQCEGVTADGCAVSMATGVGQVPSTSQALIEHTLFGFTTGGGQRLDGGQVCSLSPACGLNQFDVRIERLTPGVDGGT